MPIGTSETDLLLTLSSTKFLVFSFASVKEPLNFNVNSEGAKLNIQLTEDELNYNLTNKKKQSTATKKRTKTVDRGVINGKKEVDTSLKLEDTTKQNPWRPPWYVSGLVVLALLVVYKVLKGKFKIVKIQN